MLFSITHKDYYYLFYNLVHGAENKRAAFTFFEGQRSFSLEVL